MMSSDLFKIVIGDSWRAAIAEGGGPFSVGTDDAVDFSRVRDRVDIYVGKTGILGHIDEDSIFFLVRDMLLAVEKLACCEGTVRVSFYEGPWELVLQRVGRVVYVTMYRGGKRPEVIVKDQAVLFSTVAEGVRSSAEMLYRQALELDASADGDPVIQGMMNVKSRVDALLENRPADTADVVPEYRLVESTRWLNARTPESFSFGFKFKASSTDLLTEERPQGSDLNPLLFLGRHAVHAGGRRIVFGEGYLFLQTERLLASLRQLLTAWEEGRSMSARLVSDGLVIGIRLGRDDGLVVTLMDSHNEDAIIVLNDLSPLDYAEAVLGVSRELRRLIVEQSPSQRKNLRVESFSREVRALTTWTKHNRLQGIINEKVDKYRKPIEPSRIVSSPPIEIGNAGRLRFSERWRVEVEGIDLDGTMRIGRIAAVAARGAVLGVDAESGSVLWRREIDRTESRCMSVGADGLARVMPSGIVEMLDLFTGVLKWRMSLSPRSGGAPVLLVMDHGSSPGLVVVAEEERKLTALDIRTGEPRWRFNSSRSGRFGLRRFGRLLYVISNDGNFNAVDIESGELVWRFCERTLFVIPPAVVDDMLIAVGGRPGRPEGRLFGLDPFSGELKWKLTLGGGALTSPIISGGVALIPIRSAGRHELIALNILSGEILWRKECDSGDGKCSLMALNDCFVTNAEGGLLSSLDSSTGENRWTTVLGPTCSDDVPFNLKVTLRSGLLFVPADTVYVVRPEDGHVVHSLGGEPPVPDLLHVDNDLSVFIGEESGHIAMYDLASRLSIVS
jgi:outer membrane protein assembly factor BamB